MHATNAGPPDYAGFARDMRQRFLSRPAAEWGMAPTAAHPDVYGVLVEWLSEGATHTVAAFRDGSASVYSTRGTGTIGGQEDDVVRGEARALVEAAAGFLGDAAPAAAFPYPAPGRVQFYLLTFGGVRALDAALDAACGGEGPYAGSYGHAWAVFERLLAVTGQQAPPANGCGYRKEWCGPEGYVNCLLAVMSRGITRSLAVSASPGVPDLEALAAGSGELRAWLAAQEFPYATMEGQAVIRVLLRAAGITAALPFFTRRAELPAIHAMDDGETVACVYDVEFAPFDRCARIVLAPPHDRRVRALQRQADARSVHAMPR